MRPIHFEEANITFTKPVTMDDSECLPISAYVGEDVKGNPYINTLWIPSKEDIEAFMAGRPVIVTILGNQLPPLALFTLDENGNSNE